jgi:DNA-binding FadR family transcriptional regulator
MTPSASANRRKDIAAFLRAAIFSGRLRPGARVDQDEVASATGASRIPVREALIVLEGEGLIDWSPFRGAFVAELTEQDVRDHFALLGATAVLVSQRVVRSPRERQAEVARAVRRLFASRDDATSRCRLAELRDAFLAAGVSHRLAFEFETLTTSLPLWRFSEPSEPPALAAGLDPEATARAYYDDLGERVVRRLRDDGFWPF